MSELKAKGKDLTKEEEDTRNEYFPYKHIPIREPGPNILEIGFPGNGKTHAIASLLKAGLEVFVIFTEQGRESLLEGLETFKCTEEERSRLHWTMIETASPGFAALGQIARKINQSNQKALAGMDDIAGNKYQQALKLINTCANYTDQNGEEYGDVSTWGNDRALVVDGLSGVNDMMMDLVVGGKPVKSKADWQIAMDAEMRFIKQLCNDTRCILVMTGHLDREQDEVTGKITVTPSLLGTKNGTKIGRLFSDVLYCTKEAGKFVWYTEDSSNEQLKTRNLDVKKKSHPQSFVPLIERWAGRYGSAPK